MSSPKSSNEKRDRKPKPKNISMSISNSKNNDDRVIRETSNKELIDKFNQFSINPSDINIEYDEDESAPLLPPKSSTFEPFEIDGSQVKINIASKDEIEESNEFLVDLIKNKDYGIVKNLFSSGKHSLARSKHEFLVKACNEIGKKKLEEKKTDIIKIKNRSEINLKLFKLPL